ncbi:hypothetical protein [Candidatus Uabimicrobium sp. HlEnr_7]|uniref:hypothetical protein n=1 Tax=Candidatus Uabimicrobium helgolandensis TaxID=3095367 RepID=UPI0035582583
MLKTLFYIVMCSLIAVTTLCEEYNTAEIVSDSTTLYVEINDGSKLYKEMKTTGVWQLFLSKEWQAFFQTMPSEIFEATTKIREEIESKLDSSLSDAVMSFSGHMSIAVDNNFNISISWDLGNQKEKIISSLKKLYIENVPGANILVHKVNDHNVYELVATNSKSAFYSVVENTLLTSTDKDFFAKAFTKQVKNSLADLPMYQNIKKKTIKEKDGAFLYVNPTSIIEWAEKSLGKHVASIMKTMGVNSIQSLGAGLYFENGQVVETLQVYMPERHGLLKEIIPTTTASRSLEKFIPQNLISLHHGYINLKSTKDIFYKILNDFSPNTYNEFIKTEQQINDQLGINIDEALADLGTEYLFTISFSNGLLPDVALQLSLTNLEKFKSLLNKISQAIPENTCYNSKWNGYEINYFQIFSLNNFIPVSPTYIISDDRVLFTLFPESVKNLIVQKNGHFPKDLEQLLKNVRYTNVQYLNLQKLVIPVYSTVVPLVQAIVPRSYVPIDFTLLPDATTLEKYLENSVQVFAADSEGLSVKFYSPFGVYILPIISKILSMDFKIEDN